MIYSRTGGPGGVPVRWLKAGPGLKPAPGPGGGACFHQSGEGVSAPSHWDEQNNQTQVLNQSEEDFMAVTRLAGGTVPDVICFSTDTFESSQSSAKKHNR